MTILVNQVIDHYGRGERERERENPGLNRRKVGFQRVEQGVFHFFG